MAQDKDMKKEAKLTALKGLRKTASEMMGSGIKDAVEPKKTVTVAADNTEDLKKGLDKAKEIVPDFNKFMEESEDEDGMDTVSEEEAETVEDEAEESPEYQMEEEHELRERIKELEAKLAKMSK